MNNYKEKVSIELIAIFALFAAKIFFCKDWFIRK